MASKDKGSITLYEGEYKLVGEGYEAKALTLVGSVTLYVEGALSVKDGGEDSCFITSLSSKYEVKNIIVKINKRVYCFIINIIKVNTEYVKSQKCHVYKRTGKVYNNPHPGSGVV